MSNFDQGISQAIQGLNPQMQGTFGFGGGKPQKARTSAGAFQGGLAGGFGGGEFAGQRHRSSRSAMINMAKAQGLVPECYRSQEFSRPGGRTCLGYESRATMTPEQRHARKVQIGRTVGIQNLRKAACVRAQPNYRSRSGTLQGKLYPESLAKMGINPAECGPLLAQPSRRRGGFGGMGQGAPFATQGVRHGNRSFDEWD